MTSKEVNSLLASLRKQAEEECQSRIRAISGQHQVQMEVAQTKRKEYLEWKEEIQPSLSNSTNQLDSWRAVIVVAGGGVSPSPTPIPVPIQKAVVIASAVLPQNLNGQDLLEEFTTYAGGGNLSSADSTNVMLNPI